MYVEIKMRSTSHVWTYPAKLPILHLSNMKQVVKSAAIVLTLLSLSGVATAASFGFNVLVRAGLNTTGDWEVGMGLNSSGVPTVQAQMSPYFLDGSPQRFEIGYTAGTGTAYTRIFSGAAPSSTMTVNLSYSVPGATILAPSDYWTLPASSFYTSASVRPVPTSVSVQGMVITGNQVLNPLSLTASSNGITATNQNQSAPILFQAQANGDWQLSGNLTMTGLSAYTSSGAQRSQLQFGLTAQADPTPEPGTFALMGGTLGLILVGLRVKRKANC